MCGFDCSAITLIGVKLPRSCLYVTKTVYWTRYRSNCSCNVNANYGLYCSNCGNQNTAVQTEHQEHQFHPKVSGGKYIEERVSSLGPYKAFYESYGEEFNDFIFFPIYTGEKYGPRMWDKEVIVKCPLKLEEIIEKREEMRKFLRDENIVTSDELFDRYFGIHTLVNGG